MIRDGIDPGHLDQRDYLDLGYSYLFDRIMAGGGWVDPDKVTEAVEEMFRRTWPDEEAYADLLENQAAAEDLVPPMGVPAA